MCRQESVSSRSILETKADLIADGAYSAGRGVDAKRSMSEPGLAGKTGFAAAVLISAGSDVSAEDEVGAVPISAGLASSIASAAMCAGCAVSGAGPACTLCAAATMSAHAIASSPPLSSSG
jgi:hypothetical protein